MNDKVSWIIKLNIVEGKADEAETLMHEMIEATRQKEAGTLNYEWFFNKDKSVCHIYERYENSEAVLVHLANLGEHFLDRFMGSFEPFELTVYGNPTAEAREALDDLGAQYLSPEGGFSR